MKRYIVLTAVFLSLASFVFALEREREIPSSIRTAFGKAGIPLLKKRMAPKDFTLRLLDGSSVNLSSLKGKVVFLNFWTTWCPPCREEMPSIQALSERFKNKDIVFLAVNIRENSNVVSDFIKKNSLTFKIPLDQRGDTAIAYGARTIPMTFIIDREGKIILREIGAMDWNTPQIAAAIEELLKHE